MGTMENKAKKMIRRYEAELLKNPGQYTLKSFNEEIKDVIKRLVNHDRLEDVHFSKFKAEDHEASRWFR